MEIFFLPTITFLTGQSVTRPSLKIILWKTVRKISVKLCEHSMWQVILQLSNITCIISAFCSAPHFMLFFLHNWALTPVEWLQQCQTAHPLLCFSKKMRSDGWHEVLVTLQSVRFFVWTFLCQDFSPVCSDATFKSTPLEVALKRNSCPSCKPCWWLSPILRSVPRQRPTEAWTRVRKV